ncbi:MAG: phosphodiesterase [Microbacteriaceae bacterium]|nr:phosphodiesterase [Microbacteriaceae bacterium]
MIQLGLHPAPAHVIAHFSDTHLVGGDRALFGAVNSHDNLLLALGQLERSGTRPEAIVFTGDLADLGEVDAYRRLRSTVEPVAERMGTRIVWVMGNHDERFRFQSELFDQDGSNDPQDRVYDINGLRIVALDTSVPGYHHGDLSDGQLDWLTHVLAEPAPDGTLLAMHHPPIPSPVEVMAILELQRQDRLAEVIRGTDVRGVLAGHLHYSAHSIFAGVPVSVASATCYSIDISATPKTFSGVGGGHGFALVHVYEEQIVHSAVAVGDFEQVSGFSETFLAKIAAMSPAERLEVFSSKTSSCSVEDIERR